MKNLIITIIYSSLCLYWLAINLYNNIQTLPNFLYKVFYGFNSVLLLAITLYIALNRCFPNTVSNISTKYSYLITYLTTYIYIYLLVSFIVFIICTYNILREAPTKDKTIKLLLPTLKIGKISLKHHFFYKESKINMYVFVFKKTYPVFMLFNKFTIVYLVLTFLKMSHYFINI